MSAKERSEQAQRRLAVYCALAREYRAVWGFNPDKEVFLNLWAQARKECEK
jgi:hypothetical protein